MKPLVAFFQNHKRLARGLILSFFVFMGCFVFPLYNLTKQFSTYITISNLIIAVGIFWELGKLEHRMYPKAKWYTTLTLNLGLVLAGMACRYLLEFGEVSNTYNFTLPNIALHIPILVGISTLSWYQSRK